MTAFEPENPLRWRFCRAADCGALFFVCKHCDRGQRYCSDRCRNEGRRKQRREASSRYQRSETGRSRHLLRQRAYRQRHLRSSVTHQGYRQPIQTISQSLCSTRKCAFCQVENHWTDSFDQPSQRLWRKFIARSTGECSNFFTF